MQNRYFAASNSSRGFKNYFKEVLSDADLLYVVKGGPGTGKSSFMKRCSKRAEEKGYYVENFCCSSDADSLEGVLVFDGERKIGIFDGTPPHVWEPKLVGAVERTVNLGEFWSEKALASQKNEIKALTRKKETAYNKAYTYLRSCGNLRAVTDMLLRDVVDYSKLCASAERLADRYGRAKNAGLSRTTSALIDAVTMKGIVHLDTYDMRAVRIFKIGTTYGVGQIYLKELLDRLSHKGLKIKAAYDAVCPWLINGIFVEDDKTAYILSDNTTDSQEGTEREKYVNTKRFINSDELRNVRCEIRYAEKLSHGALEGALHALSEVNVYHFLLEDIYKNSMDFKSLGEYTAKFIDKMFM